MGKRRKTVTAEEFMKELEKNEAYQKAMKEKAQERAERERHHRKIEAPILEEIRNFGLEISRLDELTNKNNTRLSPETAGVLLSWMPRVAEKSLALLLVQPIAATNFRLNGSPIADLFDRFDDERVRWATANTMAEAKLTGIEDWLCRRFPDRSLGSARQMMATAVAKHVPKERALPLLRDALDEMPGHVAMALRWVGEREDVERMKEIRDDVKPWERREIDKAIKRIEKRLAKKG